MAETGNSILDVATLLDMQSRLSAIEAMIGKTNIVTPLVADLSGFQFINGNSTTDTGIAGIANIKIFSRQEGFDNYKPGDTVSKKITISSGGFENAKYVWVSATPLLKAADGSKITPTAYVNKSSNKEFTVYLDSPTNSTWKKGTTTKVWIHFIAIAVF